MKTAADRFREDAPRLGYSLVREEARDGGTEAFFRPTRGDVDLVVRFFADGSASIVRFKPQKRAAS